MPQTAASRELTVTYGTFDFLPANGIVLDAADGGWEIVVGYSRSVFKCRFSMRLETPASPDSVTNAESFATLTAAMDTALRKPRQRLLVKFGTVTRVDWNTTTKNAFHIEGEVRKTGVDDSNRIAHFEFTATASMSSDLSGLSYRQASDTKTVSTIQGRRTAVITGRWTAGGSATALANYTTNGDAFFTGQLPTNVSSGEWVLVETDPSYDDENAVLSVTRTYWEVVNGLRDYAVSVAKDLNQAVALTIRGRYTKTSAATAKANFTANAATFIAAMKTSITPGVTYEARPHPRAESFNTTEETYEFAYTYHEIVYDQGESADDANAVEFTLDVELSTPFGTARTTTDTLRPLTLQRATATYTAVIDKNSSGGTDLENLWRDRYRAHAVNAIVDKLGGISADLIANEVVGLDLRGNRIVARLELDVIGSDVISLSVVETIRATGASNPVPRADGTAHSYYLYKAAPRRTLSRLAVVVYRLGGTPPVLFKPGESASTYDLVNTQKTIEDALAGLERGEPFSAPGWLPLDGETETRPETRWEADVHVAVRTQREEWLYVAALEQALESETTT